MVNVYVRSESTGKGNRRLQGFSKSGLIEQDQTTTTTTALTTSPKTTTTTRTTTTRTTPPEAVQNRVRASKIGQRTDIGGNQGDD